MDLRKSESYTEKGKQKSSLPPLRLQDIGIPKLLLIVAAGVLLLVMSMPTGWFGDSNDTTKQDTTLSGASSIADNTEASAMEIYTDKKEEQLEEMLSKVQGIGEVEVMITLAHTQEKNNLQESSEVQEVEGVLVVAQGAGDAQKDAEIIQAVQALFSLESHKIRVMKME